MKNLLPWFLFALLLPPAMIAQSKDEDLLNWDANRKLTWADYKARPDPSSDAAASTTTYLGIEYNIKTDRFSFKIQSRFSRDRSWGLHKTEYILSHEQGHFDIAEIFARKLNMKMSNYRFDRKTYDKDLRKIYQEIIDGKEEMQDKYDKETNHSINKVRQEEWLKKISEMLEEYKAYADY